MRTGLLLLLPAACAPLAAQTVTRIDLGPARQMRPFESAVVQVKVYATVDGKEGRIRNANWRAASPDGGWISKPFKFQGEDNEGYLETAPSTLGRILSQVKGQFLVKDSFLWTAPEKPGRYRVEASIGNVRGETEITIVNAPPQVSSERWSFDPEPPSRDPYRKLAERWAPFVAQETWFDWRADALCRSDFDGDLDGGNNWDNLGIGSSQAYAYYAAFETATHWFLNYSFFHARDYSDNCVAGTCHENDDEGVILTIRKDGAEFGKLEAMETLAHNMVYSYVNDPAIRGGAHNVEGPIEFLDGRPVVFLEAGGHGALGGGDKKSTFNPKTRKWERNTGITYVFKGVGERPRHAMDSEVGYDLLSIQDHWWPRANSKAGNERFMSEWFDYRPLGGRPGMKRQVAGSFFGLKHGAHKAKPFWGWHDMNTQRKKILATGQWGADPAYGVTRNLTFPASMPVSLDYLFNPYLDIGAPDPPVGTVTVAKAVTGVTVQPVQATAVATAPAAVTPAATTSATPVTPVAPRPNLPESETGACRFEVFVDGIATLRLENGTPRIDTRAGAPAEIKLSDCSAIPRGFLTVYEVQVSESRGKVELPDTHKPEVQIRDDARGAALYKFELRWKQEIR